MIRWLRRKFESDAKGEAVFPLLVLSALFFFDEFDTAAFAHARARDPKVVRPHRQRVHPADHHQRVGDRIARRTARLLRRPGQPQDTGCVVGCPRGHVQPVHRVRRGRGRVDARPIRQRRGPARQRADPQIAAGGLLHARRPAHGLCPPPKLALCGGGARPCRGRHLGQPLRLARRVLRVVRPDSHRDLCRYETEGTGAGRH